MRQMHIEKMELPNRLLLLIVPLLCFGHFGVYGRSTFEPNVPSSTASSQNPNIETNPVDTQTGLDNIPSSPASSQNPNIETKPLDSRTGLESIPSSPASSQNPFVNPMSPRTTYPRTPFSWSPTTIPSAAPSSIPFEVSSAVVSTIPSTLFGAPQSPVYTPLKSTPPRRQQSETTLPSNLQTGIQPTLALTSIPVNSPPSSAPQRSQLTFTNKYGDLKGTDYDVWTHRTNAQRQLADFCKIPIDRITNVAVDPSPSGNLVLRFSIEQGWPVYTEEALQNLKKRLSTDNLRLADKPLTSPLAVYWTDNGPCPNDTCLNNGLCDVTLASEYKCSCDNGYTGVRCQDPRAMPVSTATQNNNLFALLVLLVIPVAIAVVVGFVFGLRKQRKQQLKKAFDLRDVRTIGPRSMLSLPMEPGMRNEMYDTRSFALAFSDTTFSKNVPSSTNDDSSSKEAF